MKLTLVLVGVIWAAMEFAPELDSPVFRTEVAEVAPAPVVQPEAIPVAVITPVEVVSAPVVELPVVEVPDEPLVVVEPEKIEVVAEATPEPEAIEPQPVIWYVKGSKVNVREGPSTSFAVAGQVVYGEAAEVISDLSGDWIKIRIEGDGVEGFIAKRFMTEQDPLGG